MKKLQRSTAQVGQFVGSTTVSHFLMKTVIYGSENMKTIVKLIWSICKPNSEHQPENTMHAVKYGGDSILLCELFP